MLTYSNKMIRYYSVRLYYLDESEGDKFYIRSAFGIDAEVWSEVFYHIRDWRRAIKAQYFVPMHKELHAYELLHGKGLLKFKNGTYERLTVKEGVAIIESGLQLMETIANSFVNQVEVINVALKKSEHPNTDIISLERILNRINTSSESCGKYVFCIFDEGKEGRITQFYRKALKHNPIPSRFGKWESGDLYKNIPPKRIVGNPAFRPSKDDYFLQMTDFVAHVLLKKREKPTKRVSMYNIDKLFDLLDICLNKKASGSDPKGVVSK